MSLKIYDFCAYVNSLRFWEIAPGKIPLPRMARIQIIFDLVVLMILDYNSLHNF